MRQYTKESRYVRREPVGHIPVLLQFVHVWGDAEGGGDVRERVEPQVSHKPRTQRHRERVGGAVPVQTT